MAVEWILIIIAVILYFIAGLTMIGNEYPEGPFMAFYIVGWPLIFIVAFLVGMAATVQWLWRWWMRRI